VAVVDYCYHSASLGLDQCGRPDVHSRLVVVQVAVGMVECLEAGHRAEVAHLSVFRQRALAVNAGGGLEEDVAHSVAVVCFGGGCLRVYQSRPWGWYSPHPGLRLSEGGSPVVLDELVDGIHQRLVVSKDSAASRLLYMLEVDVDVRELASDHRLQVADDAVDVGLGGSAAPVGGLGRKLDGDNVAHVLLWFAVFVAFDVIKMGDAQPSVYRENRFSVDLRENPMFAGVKQGSKISFESDFRQARCPGAS